LFDIDISENDIIFVEIQKQKEFVFQPKSMENADEEEKAEF